MKSLLIFLSILIAFALIPALSNAQTDQPSAANTLLAPALIREGDLAVALAEGLKLGAPKNEAEAEDELNSAGISPRNGWIADYPATPDIIGELQASISAAADSGKLGVGREAALKTFQQVLSGDNLPVNADLTGNGPAETAAPNYPDTSAIDNYYADEGPPVVSYYAPPADYAYLYSWVPYPFWWEDFWFPGFFVLSDFNVRVHGHHGHDVFITNHFHDTRTGSISRIDPANRFHGGTVGTVWSSPSARSGVGAGREYRGYGVSHNPAGTRSSAFEHSVNSQAEHAASDRGFQSRSSAGQISGGGHGGGSPRASGGDYRGGGGGGGGFHGGGGGGRR
ncbi:MAG TPA: hypothetical protein VEJ88_04950 [Dissulfurispiraceae bacterium]|nr:hypothetical protein [Dissulfurispiraceae bacterium]